MTGIPSENDWGDWHADLDQEDAHEQLFGLTHGEAKARFATQNPVDVGEMLHFIAPVPFRYYMKAFAEHVTEVRGEADIDVSSKASVFLGLVRIKLVEAPEDIAPVLKDLLPIVRMIGQSQAEYDAPEQIYGRFADKAKTILELADSVRSGGAR